jgi:hypothetical protein
MGAQVRPLCPLMIVYVSLEDSGSEHPQFPHITAKAETAERFDGSFDDVGNGSGRLCSPERGEQRFAFFAGELTNCIREKQEYRRIRMHPIIEIRARRVTNPRHASAERTNREIQDNILLMRRADAGEF